MILILDRATFDRLHQASLCPGPVIVRSHDLRALLDAAAEIDRQCQAMTRELADAKGQLIQLAAGETH